MTPLDAIAVGLRHVTDAGVGAESQLYGAQIVAGPALQRPCPSQTLTPMTAAPAHVPACRRVPATCWRQAPLPSQVPSRPQLDVGAPGRRVGVRGAPPAGTTAQMPGEPWTLQAGKSPLQAVLQQTPSTQKPL